MRTPSYDFLAGGGELGALMREYNWAKTPLGSPSSWPRALKTVVRIMLTSRQPFWLGWGPELTYLYNDPYKSIIGGKHPWALGKPFREVWREIWDVIGPMADKVMKHDEGTYVEAQMLIMERHGYQEETYYTFSYSPVPGDDGKPAGLICANTDDTRRVIGERQVETLRELASATAHSRSAEDACERAVRALATNQRDAPFALIYLADGSGRPKWRAGSAGTEALEKVGLWPCAEVMAANEPLTVRVDAALADVPKGAWPRAPMHAAVLPIESPGAATRVGALVVGLNPFRQFDPSYRGFLELAARQVAAGLANAEAHEQERKRAESLAEIDRAKTAFFSNVSHEFRTPLTLMLAPLEDALGEGGLPEAERARLEVAHRNAQRLLKLVNTLLDFSRIEAGRSSAAFEATDLSAFTAELASVFRSTLERAGLRLSVECPPLGEKAWVDREMWEKIVFNLLSNAFKFTFDGEIAVSLRREGSRALLSVADSGIGIPAAELQHVFERFHRVKDARGRSFEGSGIGLALVQELVKLHDGEVAVTSAPGRGTTFTVALPLGAKHAPAAGAAGAPRGAHPSAPRAAAFVEELQSWLPRDAAPAAAEPDSAGGAQRARILLADDNADMRGYVRRLLEPAYEVVAVADGAAALQAARAAAERVPFDLVLSDVMMPKLDGFGLIAALRAEERTRTLPIMLLSARAGEESRVEGMSAGADDYMVKPFSAKELQARVAARLEIARIRRHAEAATRELIAQLQDADRRKDEFLATLSHELRNPLAPLRNSLHLLRTSGSDGSAPIHDMMERQVNHLVRLVDDLLEMSRISRGAFDLRKERVEVAEAMRNALETSQPLVTAAGHRLELDLPREPLYVEGDPVRLAQILANLLNNAAKYTDPGGRIYVGARTAEHAVKIIVRDNGSGIAPEALPRLFEMFSREGRQSARNQEGLGIGLALSKRLAEMHQGGIEVKSAGIGKGAEFIVTLPLAGDQKPLAAAGVASEAQLAPRRILVVDDNRDAADSLAMVLTFLGADVRVARDGPQAIEAFDAYDPSVVLLDIGMPGMDGYEVARRIRSRYPQSRAALVALTGWGQDKDRQLAREAGFDRHLIKPAEIGALQSLLSSL